MPDNQQVDKDAVYTARTLEKSAGVDTQVVTLDVGGSGSEKLLSEANPMPSNDAAGNTLLTAIQTLLTTLSGTIYNHNAPFVDGSPGQLMLGKRRDSDTTLVADGDLNTFNLDEVGRLKVSTQPASYTDGAGDITANAQSVSLNVDRASNVTISMVATSLVGHNAIFEYSNNSTDGANGTWYGVQVARSNANTADTTTGVLAATPAYGWEVSVNAYKWFRVRATSHTSGTASYIIKQGTYATEPVPVIQVTGTQPVSGSVTATGIAGAAAHDAVISGNPVRLSGRALTANYTAVASGDTADLITTLVGALVQKPYAIPEADWTYAAASGGIVNTTDVAAKVAAAAGIRNYVTAINLSNNSATATEFVIKDGASTVLWRCHLPANQPTIDIQFPTPLRGSAATALNVACITTGAAVYANLQGYIAP